MQDSTGTRCINGWWEDLPVELWDIILKMAMDQRSDKMGGKITSYVIPFVCRTWLAKRRNVKTCQTVRLKMIFECWQRQWQSLWRWLTDSRYFQGGQKLKWLADAAAASGNLELFSWVVERKYNSDYCTRVAAKHGHLHILRWAKYKGIPFRHDVCRAAAKKGHVDIVLWLHQQGCKLDKKVCYFIALKGNLDMLKTVREAGCPWNGSTCRVAASSGNLEMLKWARANGCPWDIGRRGDGMLKAAARRGFTEILQYCVENQFKGTQKICLGAAQGGQLEVLKWARQRGYEWYYRSIKKAANNGHLEVVKWALANGCEWVESLASRHWPIFPGNVHVYRWLLEEGYFPSRQPSVLERVVLMEKAATLGFKFDWRPREKILESAIVKGEPLSRLQWLREQGCPWTDRCCLEAVNQKRLSVLKWARADGCPWDSRIIRAALWVRSLKIFKWVCQNGCPWNDLPELWNWSYQMRSLRWAVENGYPHDWDNLYPKIMNSRCCDTIKEWATQRNNLSMKMGNE